MTDHSKKLELSPENRALQRADVEWDDMTERFAVTEPLAAAEDTAALSYCAFHMGALA